MTAIEVSVSTAEEARDALAAGAQRLLATDSARGALVPLAAVTVEAIAAVAMGKADLAATGGGDLSLAATEKIAASGVASLVVPVPDGDAGAVVISLLGRSLAQKVKLVAAFSPEAGPDFDLVPVAAMAGFSGVLLAASGSLTEAVKLADIARFVAAARRAKLTVGLSGDLRVVDVGTLLPLRPDYLSFRSAVSEDEDARRPLDPARVRAVAAAFAIHAARTPVDE